MIYMIMNMSTENFKYISTNVWKQKAGYTSMINMFVIWSHQWNEMLILPEDTQLSVFYTTFNLKCSVHQNYFHNTWY